MDLGDLSNYLVKSIELSKKMDEHAPPCSKNTEFRADLAGLLVVSMASSYESCVKEVLTSYAARHNQRFAYFAEKNFEKLNSKINTDDLHKYSRLFDPRVHAEFKRLLNRNKKRTERWAGRDIVGSYHMILSSRHKFAHAGERTTTIEEAIANHRLAMQVISSFYKAFNIKDE